jgi:hypothetical protein
MVMLKSGKKLEIAFLFIYQCSEPKPLLVSSSCIYLLRATLNWTDWLLASVICFTVRIKFYDGPQSSVLNNCCKEKRAKSENMLKICCQRVSLIDPNKVHCPRPDLKVIINMVFMLIFWLLSGALFELLDLESDVDQRQQIKDSLLFLVQATSDEHLNFWLSVCKDILASSTTTNPESILRSTLVIQVSIIGDVLVNITAFSGPKTI